MVRCLEVISIEESEGKIVLPEGTEFVSLDDGKVKCLDRHPGKKTKRVIDVRGYSQLLFSSYRLRKAGHNYGEVKKY